MSKTHQKRNPNRKPSLYKSTQNKTMVSYMPLTNYGEDYGEDYSEDNRARKFRKAQKAGLKQTPKNKESYSLSELMNMANFQSINNYSDVNCFKEDLYSFLHACFSKYINQESKISKIYSLLTSLRKNNPTISYKELNFLKSLVNEKEYYIEK